MPSLRCQLEQRLKDEKKTLLHLVISEDWTNFGNKAHEKLWQIFPTCSWTSLLTDAFCFKILIMKLFFASFPVKIV